MVLKRTPMPRPTKPLERHQPLRQVSPRKAGLKASAMKQTRSRFLRDPAAVIEERSGRVCEIQLEGCYGRAAEKSHRITQKAGGRHGAAKVRSDRPSNALDACSWCHLVITERPWLVDAKGNGWVLEEWQEPTREPVLYRGRRVYLSDDGEINEYEAHCA